MDGKGKDAKREGWQGQVQGYNEARSRLAALQLNNMQCCTYADGDVREFMKATNRSHMKKYI